MRGLVCQVLCKATIGPMSQEPELRFQVSRLRSVELRRGKQVSGFRCQEEKHKG
jgi:hypothetical protein